MRAFMEGGFGSRSRRGEKLFTGLVLLALLAALVATSSPGVLFGTMDGWSSGGGRNMTFGETTTTQEGGKTVTITKFVHIKDWATTVLLLIVIASFVAVIAVGVLWSAGLLTDAAAYALLGIVSPFAAISSIVGALRTRRRRSVPRRRS